MYFWWPFLLLKRFLFNLTDCKQILCKKYKFKVVSEFVILSQIWAKVAPAGKGPKNNRLFSCGALPVDFFLEIVHLGFWYFLSKPLSLKQ